MELESETAESEGYSIEENDILNDNLDPPAVILASAGYDHTIRFWDVVHGGCIGTLQHNESQVNCLALSRDKLSLAAGGNPAVRLYDTLSATIPSRDSLMTANLSPKHVFELQGGNVISLGFNSSSNWIWILSEDGVIRIYGLQGANYSLHKEISTGSSATCAVIHPLKTEFYVGDLEGNIRIYNMVRFSCIGKTSMSDKAAIRSLAIDNEGETICVVDNGGFLHVWKIQRSEDEDEDGYTISFEEICSVQAHKTYALKCLFSPDGNNILTSSADGSAKLWKIFEHHPSPEQSDSTLSEVDSAFEYSPRRNYFLELIRVFNGHTKWVWDCSFSADSAYVVTASSDNTLRLWDVMTGEAIAIYSGHSKAVTCLALNDMPFV